MWVGSLRFSSINWPRLATEPERSAAVGGSVL